MNILSSLLPATARSAAQRQAEAWLVLLDSSACTPEDRRRFEAWLDASQDNLAAYVDIERLHQAARTLASDPVMQRAAREARTAAARPPARPWLRLAAVASLCLFAVAGYRALQHLPDGGSQSYANAAGPPKRVALPDGIAVTLDADTQITVSQGRAGTGIDLARGRVLVGTSAATRNGVAVSAGSGVIRDIGTRFEVDQRVADAVRVSVFEGSVWVAINDRPQPRTTLQAGERVSYSSAGEVGAVEPFDPHDAGDWSGGRLVFRDEPLEAIVAEMNRYSTRKIVLQGQDVASLKVTGAFQAGDQQAVLTLLQHGWGLEADRDRRGDIVVRRPGDR